MAPLAVLGLAAGFGIDMGLTAAGASNAPPLNGRLADSGRGGQLHVQ